MNKSNMTRRAFLLGAAAAMAGCVTQRAPLEYALSKSTPEAGPAVIGANTAPFTGEPDPQRLGELHAQTAEYKQRIKDLVATVNDELPRQNAIIMSIGNTGVGKGYESGFSIVDLANRQPHDIDYGAVAIANSAELLQQMVASEAFIAVHYPTEGLGNVRSAYLLTKNIDDALLSWFTKIEGVKWKKLRERDVVRASFMVANGSPEEIEKAAFQVKEKPYRSLGRRVVSLAESALVSELTMGQPIVGFAANATGQLYDLGSFLAGEAFRAITHKKREVDGLDYQCEIGLSNYRSNEVNQPGKTFYHQVTRHGIGPVTYLFGLGYLGEAPEQVLAVNMDAPAVYDPRKNIQFGAIVEQVDGRDKVTGISLLASEKVGKFIPGQVIVGAGRAVAGGYGGKGAYESPESQIYVIPLVIPIPAGLGGAADAIINGNTGPGII